MQVSNFSPRSLTPWVVLASALTLAGCVVVPEHDRRYESEEVIYGPATSTYVMIAPPAPRVEYRGYPPAVGYLWIEGYWSWGGARYVWVPGSWVAPRPGYVWIPHRWDRDGDRWRHDGGRWEPDRRNPPPQPQPRLEQRPQVWPTPVPSRPRDEGDDRSDNDRWRAPSGRYEPQPRPDARPEVQRRAEPEQEPRQRGLWQRNEPREEAQRGNDREQRDQRRPERRGKDDDWRKDKDKDRQD